MGYPELKSDESIILTAQDVKVKTVPFELVLTNRRLIIIDSKKNLVPTQTIPLASIRNVTMGENAIRDPVITLTIPVSATDTREMVFTFARRAGGERKREADEWQKVLKAQAGAAARDTATPPTPSADVELASLADAAGQGSSGMPAGSGIKKKIETARPMKTIMDTSFLPPKPVETSSLPEGSFCNRCGNRVPLGSVFCNRCGNRVVTSAEQVAIPSTHPLPPPITPAAGTPPAEHPTRPIEQIIHSIEPLIADSVPRTAEAPPVLEQQPELPAPEQPAPAGVPEAPATEEAPAFPAPPAPVTLPLPPVPSRRSRRPRYLTVIAAVIVILAIAGAGVLLMHAAPGRPGGAANATPTPTIAKTTIPTTVPTIRHTPTPMVTTSVVQTTAQVLIPQTGVWVEVTYTGTFSGLVGTPGNQESVTDTGDKFYQVAAGLGDSVAVSVRKMDGLGDPMTVTVYVNGQPVKKASTTTPKGSIDLQAAVPTPATTAVPATTTAASSTP
jgi:hypothetical protein